MSAPTWTSSDSRFDVSYEGVGCGRLDKLMDAHAVAAQATSLLRALEGKRRLLVLTHTNPDPDSIGSALGLRHLAREKLGMETDLALTGRIMRAENKAMVSELGIEMIPITELNLDDYDCLALVDTQPGFGHTDLPEGRAMDIVIDHHVPTETPLGLPSPSFSDIRTDIGATSSMVASYMMELGIEIPADVGTALLYGVKTDTADLSRNVSDLDEKVYYHLIGRVDRRKLHAITQPDLPLEYFQALRDALNNIRVFGPVVLCSLGKVMNAEIVAEVADLFLRLDSTRTVYCGGLVGNTYHISVRTEPSGRDAYYLIRAAVGDEGSFGGHGSIAGGSIQLPDDGQRTLKRLERRLERNILQSQGLEDMPLSGLGDT